MTNAQAFAILLHQVHEQTPELIREPPRDLAPCWHTLAAMDDAGVVTEPEDPIVEIAFWEFTAWAAEERFGRMASPFARLCRALADETLAGVAE